MVVVQCNEMVEQEVKSVISAGGERRVSARIQIKQREEKERLVRRRVQLLEERGDEEEEEEEERGSRKKLSLVNVEEKVSITTKICMQEEFRESGDANDSRNAVVSLTNVVEKSASMKVKETLRLFNKHYLHFVQQEELRCAKVVTDKKAVKSLKSKTGSTPEVDSKHKAKRPDLKAVSKMMETHDILYPAKRIGNLPGINVGHQFYSRAEMVAVGFHSHWLNGIDYLGQSYGKGEYKIYTLPLAVAIVLSGMYEDDLDNAEDVIYTGQGGHNLTGDKRQIRDQVLKRGNLALKNCVEQCVPVRVVRGHECASSYTGKVYTYDGLYRVVQYWADKGISGYTVYKYRLRRHEGQPILTTNQVFFTYGRVPQSASEIRGLVCEDISGGQEHIPIPATNLVDDPPVAPTGFTYCTSNEVAKNVEIPTNGVGCNCKGNCIDPKTCACAKLNGSDFPYVHRDGGRLIEARDVVFECGPKCGCGPGCVNRTSQRGLKFRLEV
ncbi:YDG_SRA domain-containing protein/Pre-SET domain-containing protein, partial [Cephalotus follicularis]